MKRKKNSRQRGSHTHGWGSKKKHRGAGHRGGRGNAGTGKHGDQKKPSIWKNKKYFGGHGFKSVNRKQIKKINIKQLESSLSFLLEKDLAVKEGDKFIINLKKAGFNKLLSVGKVTKKLCITIDSASPKAVDKVEKFGGVVNTKENVIAE